MPKEQGIYGQLSSFQVYSASPENTTFQTNTLVDLHAGIYPCYYVYEGAHLVAARTVSDLVSYLGDLQLNKDFEPPAYFQKNFFLQYLKENVYPYLSSIRGMTRLFSKIHLPEEMYQCWSTIDQRIYKLKPFEQVTAFQNTIDFNPTFSLSKKDLVHKTAEALVNHVHQVENQHPEKAHLLLLGGRDSQLIALVPKQYPDKWHIFSAQPNVKIVKKFLRKNSINFNQVFFIKNSSNATKKFLAKKVLGTDLYADPRHQKWREQLLNLQEKFSNQVLFWEGTAGASLFSHVDYFHKFPFHYFEKHSKHFATFQASNHQLTKHLTENPLLSAYHSREFIDEIYRHYDPSVFNKGEDLRPRIGKQLQKGKVWFSAKNPGPKPINYSHLKGLNVKEFYIQALTKKVNENHHQ